MPDWIKAALDRQAADGNFSPSALQWLEKLRRFASFNGRHLGRVARARFGADAGRELAWMTGFLVAGGRAHPDRGEAPVDPACLSAAWYCADAAGDTHAELATAEAALRAWLLGGGRQPAPAALGPEVDFLEGRWESEAAAGGSIVLIAPSPFSLYALAALEMCLRLGLPIKAVVLRSFSARRFVEEWRRDGRRIFRKIWRKLVLRADENQAAEGLSLKEAVRRLSPAAGDVRTIARRRGICVAEVERFADAAPLLEPLRPEIGLFTGGGMIDAATLGLFSRGIINVHMGHLPHYKGMDVVQAQIAEGRPSVGATAHLMVPALDAGPALLKCSVETDRHRSLGALRNTVACLLPFMLLDSALGLLSGRLAPLEQPPAGRQYYIMHPRLAAIVEEVLAAHAPPSGADPSRALVERILTNLPVAAPGHHAGSFHWTRPHSRSSSFRHEAGIESPVYPVSPKRVVRTART